MSLTAELSFVAGQSGTVTHANTWSETVTLDIPSKNAIKPSIMLNEAHVDTPFTATFLAQGRLKYTLNTSESFFASLDGVVDWATRPDPESPAGARGRQGAAVPDARQLCRKGRGLDVRNDRAGVEPARRRLATSRRGAP